jgi:hypothetical protein
MSRIECIVIAASMKLLKEVGKGDTQHPCANFFNTTLGELARHKATTKMQANYHDLPREASNSKTIQNKTLIRTSIIASMQNAHKLKTIEQ